ncbi:hypothetical protein Q1695_003312 [Nippostrongylus brasiliensis]|nr:hypothetical protein Q1695_003312 [Nippostrongylus brasiliensis]
MSEVFRVAGCVQTVASDETGNELFLALDKELDDVLEKAIDDLPQKLDEYVLQRVEGSGDWPSTASPYVVEDSTNTTISSTPTEYGTTSQLNITGRARDDASISSEETETMLNITVRAKDAIENTTHGSVLLQMLSKIALANLPPQVGVEDIAERLVAEAVNDEMDDLLTSVKAAAAQQSTLVPLSSTPSASVMETTTRAIGIDSRVEKLHTPTLCSNNTVCYKDSECGQGRCPGASLGKCNCHACVANTQCSADADCGGLRNACQNGSCRCAEALAKHGFPLYISVLMDFCSQRSCTIESDSCFGLPCSHAYCSCDANQ